MSQDQPPFRECPGNPTTRNTCEKIPNAFWFSSPSAVTAIDQNTKGQCICCVTDGTAYVDSSATSAKTVCKTCGSDVGCGGQNGFCKEQGNPNCQQDPKTLKWSIVCPSNVSCGQGCSGSCGGVEWFAFQMCSQDNNTGKYSCSFSLAQWKSWLVYGAALFVIIAVILIFTFYRRRETHAIVITKPTKPIVTGKATKPITAGKATKLIKQGKSSRVSFIS